MGDNSRKRCADVFMTDPCALVKKYHKAEHKDAQVNMGLEPRKQSCRQYNHHQDEQDDNKHDLKQEVLHLKQEVSLLQDQLKEQRLQMFWQQQHFDNKMQQIQCQQEQQLWQMALLQQQQQLIHQPSPSWLLLQQQQQEAKRMRLLQQQQQQQRAKRMTPPSSGSSATSSPHVQAAPPTGCEMFMGGLTPSSAETSLSGKSDLLSGKLSTLATTTANPINENRDDRPTLSSTGAVPKEYVQLSRLPEYPTLFPYHADAKEEEDI